MLLQKKLFGWKPRRCGGGLGGKKQSGQLRFGGSQRPFKKPFHINEQVKQRWKYLEKQKDQYKKNLRSSSCHGQTRIHIDQVKGFESSIFIELEVILQDNQTSEQGQLIAKDLCQRIGIQEKNHIKSADIDLLLEKNSTLNYN
ncbi:unnamed protein product [Rotaria sp. Silwood1]|nr:unnamed protein product [Rotaria sp. Silwood1]